MIFNGYDLKQIPLGLLFLTRLVGEKPISNVVFIDVAYIKISK